MGQCCSQVHSQKGQDISLSATIPSWPHSSLSKRGDTKGLRKERFTQSPAFQDTHRKINPYSKTFFHLLNDVSASNHLFQEVWRESVSRSVMSRSCKPMTYSPPGSSVHEILQVRILEWVALSFSRGSSWPRDWTPISHITGRFFTFWAEGA